MNIKALTGLAVLALGASVVRAEVVYDLSSSANSNFYRGVSEYGDELRLGGTERIIESFSFSYFSDYAQAGGLKFKIYANDGLLINGSKSPSSVLDSRTFDIVNGGGNIKINYPFAVDNVLPETITFTVSFDGLVAGNRAGLVLPNASPSTGSSLNDAWQKTGPGPSDWTLIGNLTDASTGSLVLANFKATVTATAVPEPGTVALLGLGGLGLALVARRRS